MHRSHTRHLPNRPTHRTPIVRTGPRRPRRRRHPSRHRHGRTPQVTNNRHQLIVTRRSSLQSHNANSRPSRPTHHNVTIVMRRLSRPQPRHHRRHRHTRRPHHRHRTSTTSTRRILITRTQKQFTVSQSRRPPSRHRTRLRHGTNRRRHSIMRTRTHRTRMLTRSHLITLNRPRPRSHTKGSPLTGTSRLTHHHHVPPRPITIPQRRPINNSRLSRHPRRRHSRRHPNQLRSRHRHRNRHNNSGLTRRFRPNRLTRPRVTVHFLSTNNLGTPSSQNRPHRERMRNRLQRLMRLHNKPNRHATHRPRHRTPSHLRHRNHIRRHQIITTLTLRRNQNSTRIQRVIRTLSRRRSRNRSTRRLKGRRTHRSRIQRRPSTLQPRSTSSHPNQPANHTIRGTLTPTRPCRYNTRKSTNTQHRHHPSTIYGHFMTLHSRQLSPFKSHRPNQQPFTVSHHVNSRHHRRVNHHNTVEQSIKVRHLGQRNNRVKLHRRFNRSTTSQSRPSITTQTLTIRHHRRHTIPIIVLTLHGNIVTNRLTQTKQGTTSRQNRIKPTLVSPRKHNKIHHNRPINSNGHHTSQQFTDKIITFVTALKPAMVSMILNIRSRRIVANNIRLTPTNNSKAHLLRKPITNKQGINQRLTQGTPSPIRNGKFSHVSHRRHRPIKRHNNITINRVVSGTITRRRRPHLVTRQPKFNRNQHYHYHRRRHHSRTTRSHRSRHLAHPIP